MFGTRFENGSAQYVSPFFKKLNTDTRRLIYIELFGKSLVHIGFSQPTTGFERDKAPKLPGLWHCICRRSRKEAPHMHSEGHHKWCYLATSVLFTCKFAFEEGIRILYATNSFIFQSPRDISTFQSYAMPYLHFVRFVDVVVGQGARRHQGDWLPELKALCTTICKPFQRLNLRIRVLKNCRSSVGKKSVVLAIARAMQKLLRNKPDFVRYIELFLSENILPDVRPKLKRLIEEGVLALIPKDAYSALEDSGEDSDCKRTEIRDFSKFYFEYYHDEDFSNHLRSRSDIDRTYDSRYRV